MRRNSFRLFALSILMVLAFSGSAPCQMLNPYIPHNAVAAEPPTPYYEDDTPCGSYVYSPPCPTCGPVAAQFPDVPSLRQPIPGMFGLPVPVP